MSNGDGFPPSGGHRKIKGYGWIPDIPDYRDHPYNPPRELLEKLPADASVRRNCPPVYTQGDLASCTANAIAAAIEVAQRKEDVPHPFLPSRLFIYYNEREVEGTVRFDRPAMLRDGIKSVAAEGVCQEILWPYDAERFAERPPDKCYRGAQQHRIGRYERLRQELDHMKACLAEGYPFVFGFAVYESFEDPNGVAKTGHALRPLKRRGQGEPERPPGHLWGDKPDRQIGGHAVLAVGYEDRVEEEEDAVRAGGWFWVRNSWGPNWGSEGYFTLPYDYISNHGLAHDFWTIRGVEGLDDDCSRCRQRREARAGGVRSQQSQAVPGAG